MQDSERGCATDRERSSVAGSSGSVKRRSRRRWSAEQKVRIVGESLSSGARVEDVARRYGLSRKQLSAWRSLARQGKLAVASSPEAVDVDPERQPAFATLEVDSATGPGLSGSVVIESREVTVRLDGDIDASRVSPRSRLGEKLSYIANQWEGLVVFLYDGRVEMDTNFVENRIRAVKLTAKNALFAGHDEGAAAWGRIASLIETCKMNGVEPYAWLKSTLEKIASGHPQSRIRELLLWNVDSASN